VAARHLPPPRGLRVGRSAAGLVVRWKGVHGARGYVLRLGSLELAVRGTKATVPMPRRGLRVVVRAIGADGARGAPARRAVGGTR
jgi:hypothetical protein